MNSVPEDVARGDILYCMDLAKPSLSMRSKFGKSHSFGLLGDIINDELGKGGTRKIQASVIDRCMLAHGYAVVRVTKQDWLSRLGLVEGTATQRVSADDDVVNAMAAYVARGSVAQAGVAP